MEKNMNLTILILLVYLLYTFNCNKFKIFQYMYKYLFVNSFNFFFENIHKRENYFTNCLSNIQHF